MSPDRYVQLKRSCIKRLTLTPGMTDLELSRFAGFSEVSTGHKRGVSVHGIKFFRQLVSDGILREEKLHHHDRPRFYLTEQAIAQLQEEQEETPEPRKPTTFLRSPVKSYVDPSLATWQPPPKKGKVYQGNALAELQRESAKEARKQELKAKQQPIESVKRQKPDRLPSLAAHILSLLLQGDEPKSGRDIQDLVWQAGAIVSKTKVMEALEDLAQSGKIVARAGSPKLFRLPLEGVIGLPVLENLGTRSERLGWVDRWQVHRQTGQQMPIVRWLDGSSSFSSEELLSPTKDPLYVRWVNQVRSRNLPDPPVFIPSDALRQLKERTTHQTSGNAPLLAIAKRLELVDDRARSFPHSLEGGELRHKVLDYLDEFYPGWKWGFDVRLTLRNQEAIAS